MRRGTRSKKDLKSRSAATSAMWRCVESISAKQCGKWFIPIDEAGGFGSRGAGTEEEKGEAEEKAGRIRGGASGVIVVD
jgi:hypothetical protein